MLLRYPRLRRRSSRQRKNTCTAPSIQSLVPCSVSFYPSFPSSFSAAFLFFARRAQSSLDHCPFWPAKCSREEPGNPATGPDNGDQILQVAVQAAGSVLSYATHRASTSTTKLPPVFSASYLSCCCECWRDRCDGHLSSGQGKQPVWNTLSFFFFTQFLDQIGRRQAGGTEDAIAVTSFSMERRSSLPMKCYSVPGEEEAQLPVTSCLNCTYEF